MNPLLKIRRSAYDRQNFGDFDNAYCSFSRISERFLGKYN